MRSNEVDYVIASDGYLSDTQVAMLLGEKLATHPTIDLYDSSFITPLNKENVAQGAKKTILIGQGVDIQNIGSVFASTYESLTNNSPHNAKDFNFVVPVCIRAATPANTQNLTGRHWVLAVIKPENLNETPGKISYKMTFADSMYDGGSDKSPTGIAIFQSLKSAGIDVGNDFVDKSIYQQKKDGWSCGYHVAENAIDILDNQQLRSHDANALKKDAQLIFDLSLAAGILANSQIYDAGKTSQPQQQKHRKTLVPQVEPGVSLKSEVKAGQESVVTMKSGAKQPALSITQQNPQAPEPTIYKRINGAQATDKTSRRNALHYKTSLEFKVPKVQPGMDSDMALAIRLQQVEVQRAKNLENLTSGDEAYARRLAAKLNGSNQGGGRGK